MIGDGLMQKKTPGLYIVLAPSVREKNLTPHQ